jgi:diguanylate cyclase (GGDEF)-like protein
MMPGMDGYSTARAIKADPILRSAYVIFITAMDREESEISAFELGAVDYITKPFNPAIVRLRVRNQLELKRHRDAQARLALLDGLTGLPNRRAFDDYLRREWLRAQRGAATMAMLMIDIDFFKNYNDLYGHLRGDDCLRGVASAIGTCLSRPADLAARYGGEEFACILPDTDREGALIIAERLRSGVESLAIPHGDSEASERVTISLGLAALMPTGEFEPKILIEVADANLYRAKREGRNRVAG